MAVDGYLILLKHAKWLIRPPAAQATQMTMFSLVEVRLLGLVFDKRRRDLVGFNSVVQHK
jgi:hypothetical protein